MREMMMDMVSHLPERQQRIVYERYGWGGEEPATFREIGASNVSLSLDSLAIGP